MGARGNKIEHLAKSVAILLDNAEANHGEMMAALELVRCVVLEDLLEKHYRLKKRPSRRGDAKR